MVGKKEEFWINNKNGDFFKDTNENSSYLIFFQQGYKDVLINKSVLESHIKLVHTHVGVVCEYNQMYSYWFRPWLLSWPDFEKRYKEEDLADGYAN